MQNLVESAKRLLSKKVVKKDVVTTSMLKELCLVYQDSNDIGDIRDVCMILVGFAGFLRYDEIRNLKCCHVKMFDNHFSIQIESSKTDKYRKGAEILISQGGQYCLSVHDVEEIYRSSLHRYYFRSVFV